MVSYNPFLRIGETHDSCNVLGNIVIGDSQ